MNNILKHFFDHKNWLESTIKNDKCPSTMLKNITNVKYLTHGHEYRFKVKTFLFDCFA